MRRSRAISCGDFTLDNGRDVLGGLRLRPRLRQHHGRRSFERKYGLDLLAEAERYAASSRRDALV
jgi:hypothetical protein